MQTLMEVFMKFDYFNKNQHLSLEKTTKIVNITQRKTEKMIKSK